MSIIGYIFKGAINSLLIYTVHKKASVAELVDVVDLGSTA